MAIGYTLMIEQAGPRDLVEFVRGFWDAGYTDAAPAPP